MNEAGQLGQGDTETRGGPNGGVFEMGNNLLPVDVAGVNGSAAGLSVESVSLGGSSACAVLTGGLLKVRQWRRVGHPHQGVPVNRAERR